MAYAPTAKRNKGKGGAGCLGLGAPALFVNLYTKEWLWHRILPHWQCLWYTESYRKRSRY